ncbi:hypothetical protein DXT76_16550 [Halobacillus trueperi]|uniref:Uncharacterized protein n=1 Tax=Halobacillus trueperi TaxID=156205 RepID=A0A3D8VIJ6_9BACI|nr:hypothetical protein DXT76_16550 [Halobacillus trueperi]
MLAQDVPNLIELPLFLEPLRTPSCGVSPSTLFPQEAFVIPAEKRVASQPPLTLKKRQTNHETSRNRVFHNRERVLKVEIKKNFLLEV